jgi:hypothetical protein
MLPENQMTNEIITAIIGATATMGAAVLPLYLQNRKLRRETKLLSTGLAVAYYYSFIIKLFRLVDNPASRLEIKGAENQAPPKLRHATLRIYFPADLDEGSLERTSLKAKRDSESGKICLGDEQPMRVNVAVKTGGEDSDVVIVADFPMILDAASKHYSGMARNADFTRAEKWTQTSKQELDEFRAKVLKMVEETGIKDRVELINV